MVFIHLIKEKLFVVKYNYSSEKEANNNYWKDIAVPLENAYFILMMLILQYSVSLRENRQTMYPRLFSQKLVLLHKDSLNSRKLPNFL